VGHIQLHGLDSLRTSCPTSNDTTSRKKFKPPEEAAPFEKSVAGRNGLLALHWVFGYLESWPFCKGETPAMKTNATRILDMLGIQYEIREYEIDPDDLSAEKVAAAIGLPPEQVFKTLVGRGDRHGVLLAVVPADAELDFKALARLSANRSVDLVSLKEVQPLTGYIRGGVTALAGERDYPVYVEEQMQLFDVVAVSAGVRGQQMLLAPDDYVRATNAIVGTISRAGGQHE
jgi:Cys-tRNA(Pro)/Cys-tRNA(Cys) deacylase